LKYQLDLNGIILINEADFVKGKYRGAVMPQIRAPSTGVIPARFPDKTFEDKSAGISKFKAQNTGNQSEDSGTQLPGCVKTLKLFYFVIPKRSEESD
jgi:hypothetical protein